MRRFVLASILACLPLAAEEPTCPLCGKKAAAFENSPQGALQKYQFAVITHDEALLRDACQGLDDQARKRTLEHDPRIWQVARWRVEACEVDGDRATLTVRKASDVDPVRLCASRVDGLWRMDFGAEPPATMGELAQALLKQLVVTEGVWRMTDSDRNGAQDYWTQDVAAFFYARDAAGNPLKYVDVTIANADRSGLARWSKEPATPKSGYWLRAMKTDEEGKAYAQDGDGDGVASTNHGKFAFCAWPAEYRKGVTLTYIANEEGVLYEKDLGTEGTEGVDAWPSADPMTQGWKPCE